ncbi:ATP-dependent nuclease [Rhizobium sp. RAF56]|uniref:ATP-dependent nuclease n=1 Tax=Rhizobium sp. RAF56 TaxID=3233062 RepID=UPI003F95371B
MDYRRNLLDKPQRWSVQLDRFAFSDVPSLGTLEIPFNAPLTVLCGANGVGKSTVLAALRIALCLDRDTYGSNVRKLAGGSASAHLVADKRSYELSVEFGGSSARRTVGDDQLVTFVNTGAIVHQIQSVFCEFENAEELLNGAGSKELSGGDVAAINYLLQRNYRRISLSEVEIGTVAPFFEVSFEDDNYDSRTMGSGELAALYLWWIIQRVEKNSIVLIEEPESFLSPAAQETMGNFIVASAVEKGLCIVATSHSAPIIAPLPKPCVKFLYRGANGLRVTSEPTPLSLSKIGITTAPRSIVFVEDHAAKTFTKLLLERKDPLLAATVLLQVRQGEAEITRVLESVGVLEGPIKLLGMYDGDMKGKVDKKNETISMFLPGAEAIETAFMRLVQNSPRDLALAQGVGEEKIEELLAGLQGANHHDWYEEISRGLGLTKEQLFANLFVIWMRNADNEKAADAWYVEISRKLN